MQQDKLNFYIQKEGRKKAIASFNNTSYLNILYAEGIRLALTDIVTTRGSEVELDLSGISFIDSSIVDSLNLLSRLAKRFNSDFYLTHIGSELMEMFELIKAHSVFDIRILKGKHGEKEAA